VKFNFAPRGIFSKAIIALVIVAAAIATSFEGNLLIGNTTSISESNVQSDLQTSLSYPALTCPLIPSVSAENVYLSSSASGIHPLQGAKNAAKGFSHSKVSSFAMKDPLLLQGGASLSTIAINGNGWSAINSCDTGDPDAWFAGGTGDITSNDEIIVDNSGSSVATLAINIFTPHGPLSPLNRTVKPNSQVTFGIAGLAPGETSPVIEVVTLSGRVTTYLLDARSKGLTTLGGSMIPTTAVPSQSVTLMGLSARNGSSGLVRIYNSSQATAHVNGVAYSGGSNFTPVGFDSIQVPALKSIDVALPSIASNSTFTLQLSSDQSIVAGALVGTNSSFTWYGAASQVARASLELPSVKPTINLLGNNIDVLVQWNGSGSHPVLQSRELKGSGLVTFTLPTAVSILAITPSSKDHHSLLSLFSPGSNSYLAPITLPSGLVTSHKALPRPDARIISRG
jgi:hypothetical protein